MSENAHDFSSPRDAGFGKTWDFRLYLAGETPSGVAAYVNLKAACEAHLAGRYTIQTIDLTLDPAAAEEDRIFAAPTVVRRSPEPGKKVIGDLADRRKLLTGLGILDESAQPAMPGKGQAP